MLRWLVALYMTVVLAVGPGLCCCTTVYVAAPRSAAPDSPPPQRPSPCCCPGATPATDGIGTGHHHNAADGSKPSQKPDKHHCPCKDKGGQQWMAPNSTSSGIGHDVSRLLIPAFQFAAAFAAPSADPARHSTGLFPPGSRLTSWRLLNAPHMLRC